jgi:hypothetical protein
MRPALDPASHRVPRTKPTCLLQTWRPHRRRPFALVLHLHQHQSSRNLHLQYLAKNQSTQRCQSLITQGSDHPPVLEPHMVLILRRLIYFTILNLSPRNVVLSRGIGIVSSKSRIGALVAKTKPMRDSFAPTRSRDLFLGAELGRPECPVSHPEISNFRM